MNIPAWIRTLTGSGDDALDLFCGFGGLTLALEMNGILVKRALNHWDHAVAVHHTNHPMTSHFLGDVRSTHPSDHPRTRLFVGGPSCTELTDANSISSELNRVEAQHCLFEEDEKERERLIAEHQKRATMQDVIEFVRYHRYEYGLIENVVQVHKWPLFALWCKELRDLEYNFKFLYLNSMFFHDLNGVTNLPFVPQSRDRWYCVFWKKSCKPPNLDFRPLAYCPICERDVRAVQIWKDSAKKWGKYRAQYIYTCDKWHTVGQRKFVELTPYYYAGINAIDPTVPIKQVKDSTISENTRARIKAGLTKFGQDPFLSILDPGGKHSARLRPALLSPSFTATDWNNSIAIAMIDLSYSHAKHENKVRAWDKPAFTQTTRDTQAMFFVELYRTGTARSLTSPVNTVTARAIETGFVCTYNGNAVYKQLDEALPAVTTNERHGLCFPTADDVEEAWYRTLRSKINKTGPLGESYITSEIGAIQGFPQGKDGYRVFGSTDQITEGYGNAVSPAVAGWIIQQIKEVM